MVAPLQDHLPTSLLPYSLLSLLFLLPLHTRYVLVNEVEKERGGRLGEVRRETEREREEEGEGERNRKRKWEEI